MTKITLRRLIEMIIGCFAASSVLEFCKCESTLTNVTNEVRIFYVFVIVLFMIYNGYMIRHLYFRISDSFDYYLFNIISVALFFIIVIALKFKIDENIYLWMFSFADIYHYMFSGLGTIWSYVLFFITLMLSTYFSEKYYDRKMGY